MATAASPSTRPFRFGIVSGSAADSATFAELARKAESLGFSNLLIPDAPRQTPAPFPMLSWAAAATSTLHVGTYVLSNDLHHPLQVARNAATLDALSGGRFELGLGAGRPGSEDGHRQFGLTFDSPGTRRERLEESVGIIRELLDGWTVNQSSRYYTLEDAKLQVPGAGSHRPPILIAGSGDRMLRFAGEVADIVALGMAPTSSLAEAERKTATVRASAIAHDRMPELTVNLAGAGDTIHPWLQRMLAPRREELVAAGAPSLLLGDTTQMLEQLHRLREVLGVTYITAPDGLIDQLAPVIGLVN